MGYFVAGANSQAPYGFHFFPTSGETATVIFDQYHQRFFVSVPNKNEVDVLSSIDGSLISQIYVSSPYAMDLSPDSKRLYITSSATTSGFAAAEGIFVVAADSLEIEDFIKPVLPSQTLGLTPPECTVPQSVAAMKNGRIFYIARPQFADPETLFEYDPETKISIPRQPNGFFQNARLRKSPDGSRFLWLGSYDGDAWIYESNADGFVAHATIPSWDVIFSPDGNRILFNGSTLYNTRLQKIAELQEVATYYKEALAFSPDGAKIYLLIASIRQPHILVFDSASGALLGHVPAPYSSTARSESRIAVSDRGLAVLLDSAGYSVLDVSHLNPGLPSTDTPIFFDVSPLMGLPSKPDPVTIDGNYLESGADVYFGSMHATNNSVTSKQTIAVQPPPQNQGPVDVTVTFPDGWAIYGSKAYSYGPAVLSWYPNAGPASGGTKVDLAGYGIPLASTVMVGESPGSVPETAHSFNFVTPPGPVGPADIAITTAYGTVNLRNGFRYIEHKLIPNLLPFQMVLDEKRQQLYVADMNSGTLIAIDIRTLSVSTVLSLQTGSVTRLAMTPDQNRLLALSADAASLTIVDLDTHARIKTILFDGNQTRKLVPNSVAATSRGTALVSLADLLLFNSGPLYEIDLVTGEKTTVDMPSNSNHMLMAASADGSRVYLAPDQCVYPKPGTGMLGSWDARYDKVVHTRSSGMIQPICDLSTTASGDRVLAEVSTLTPDLNLVTTTTTNSGWLSTRVRGEKLHSSGSLIYMPSARGVEIYDTRTGQALLSIDIPGGLESTDDGLVVDQAGSTLYVAEPEGIGVIWLGEAPLSIGTVVPQGGSARGGNTVTLLGSGFKPGSTVRIDGTAVSTNVINTTKLTFALPKVSAKKLAIRVDNPDGCFYILPAAYDASPVNLGMNPGGATTISTAAVENSTQAGFAGISVNSGATPYGTAVFSFEQNGVTVTEAAVPASPPTTSARVFIDYRRAVEAVPGRSDAGEIGTNTGIAVVNYSSFRANVTYTLRGIDGTILSIGHGTIAGRGHFAKFINQIQEVAADFVVPPDFQDSRQFASLDIVSDQQLSIVALRGTTNQRNEFLITTTPVADITQSQKFSPAFFPHIADGGGYTSSIMLLNTSAVTETGTLRIIDNNGNPLMVNPVGGASESAFRYSIPPNGAFRFQTDGSSANIRTGWIRLIPDAGNPTPIGSGLFGYNPGQVLVSESGISAAEATTHARVFVDLSENHNTGLALANISDSTAYISITALQKDGLSVIHDYVDSGPLILAGNGHEAKFANELIEILPDGFTGILDITSPTPFAALTLRTLENERNEFMFTTFPIANANQPAASPIVFPQVADGGGYRTEFILISPAQESRTTLDIIGENATVIAVER
jgi:hypothetical protein